LKLFEGNADGYGTYDPKRTSRNDAKSGKVEIKKTADTLRGKVTEQLWESHLAGKNPLGIVPIRADGKCRWGCIDVDKYDVVHVEVVIQLEKMKLPLLVCRTKSGGAHLYLFLSGFEPAADLQAKLREIAAALGFGGSEIFPKQTQILAERGDVGNWLNMPYFGGDESDRYCFKKTGNAMTATEFLTAAEKSQTKLSAVKLSSPVATDETLNDGPPCLQHLATSGFPEGTRNNGLFAMGVFCKKKYGGDWKRVLEKYNHEYMKPPLGAEEVLEIMKNLDRREFNYRCKDAPLCDHCDSAKCRSRKFGVGADQDDFPILTSLSVLDTEPPLWFAGVGDEDRIELNTEQLQNFKLFHKVCMERMRKCFMLYKQDTWLRMVGAVMEQVTVIEAPPEASTGGYFLELLEMFCVDKHRAESKDGLSQGKPWEDEAEGRYYFKLSALMEHLERHKFDEWGRNKVANAIRGMGGKEEFTIGGKFVRVLWVPNKFKAAAPAPLPRSHKDPL
jgi:hypothetical protein